MILFWRYLLTPNRIHKWPWNPRRLVCIFYRPKLLILVSVKRLPRSGQTYRIKVSDFWKRLELLRSSTLPHICFLIEVSALFRLLFAWWRLLVSDEFREGRIHSGPLWSSFILTSYYWCNILFLRRKGLEYSIRCCTLKGFLAHS